MTAISRAYRKYGTDFFIGITDIRHYFDTMDHGHIEKQIRNAYTDPRIIGILMDWLRIEGENGRGIGLGNQINQDYAVAYLNSEDHVMHGLLDSYMRYNDDIIAIARTKEEICSAFDILESMCSKKGIELNKNKTFVIPARQGFKYLKTRYLIKDTGRIVKIPDKRSTIRTRRKLRHFKQIGMEQDYIDCYFLSHMESMRGMDVRTTAERTAKMFFRDNKETRIRKRGKRYVFN